MEELINKIHSVVFSEIPSLDVRMEKLDELSNVLIEFNKTLGRDIIANALYSYMIKNGDIFTFHQEELLHDLSSRLEGYCARKYALNLN